MRPRTRSHQEYQTFVVEQLCRHYAGNGQRQVLLLHAGLIAKLWVADVSPVFPLVLPRYSQSRRGAPPRDPRDLLRCWLCMALAGYTSVNDWITAMRSVPLFAILSGFPPDHTPGVGTLYDFQHRLWLAERIARRQRRLRKRRKPRKKVRKGEKLEPKHPGILKRLVERLERRRGQPLHSRPETLLQAIFRDTFVLPSAQKGLLGDVRHLVVAGDGTPVRTGASPHGKRVCKCKEQGIKSCQCPRAYSDPDASWGWDSYRDCWFYGRHLYEWTAAASPHDLPLYFRLVTGRRHDSVSCAVALDEFLRRYSEWRVGTAAGKAINKDTYKPGVTLQLNPDGVPVYAAGLPMRHDGYCHGRSRHKWRCPRKPFRHPETVQPPCSCSDSPYGRVLYTYHADNLRFFPRIARGTETWKTTYAKRTAAERSNKRKKIDYHLEATRVRSTEAWTWRVMLAAMCQHIDAWHAAGGRKGHDLVNSWLPPLAPAA